MIGDSSSTARGSGARLNTSKPNLSLIPLSVLEGPARVFEYGAHKYAKRRGCTCSVANALRTDPASSTTTALSAATAITGNSITAALSPESESLQTPGDTPSSTLSDGSDLASSTMISPPQGSESDSITSGEPMDLVPPIMIPLWQRVVASAEQQKSSSTSTTATQPELSEVPFALLVTKGLASWSDLTGGLPEHSSTCGLRDFDLSTGLWNWAKGMKWSVVTSSLLRHVSAIQMGELFDDESRLPHADHLMCNAIMLAHYQKHFPDLNDFQNANLLAYLKEPTHV